MHPSFMVPTIIHIFDLLKVPLPLQENLSDVTFVLVKAVSRHFCLSTCTRIVESDCYNSIWAKVIYLIKCIRMNVISKGPSLKNLCTVHSSNGRMLMNLVFVSAACT